MKTWQHWAAAVIIGYLLGYYFRGIGNMSVGKLYAGPGS